MGQSEMKGKRIGRFPVPTTLKRIHATAVHSTVLHTLIDERSSEQWPGLVILVVLLLQQLQLHAAAAAATERNNPARHTHSLPARPPRPRHGAVSLSVEVPRTEYEKTKLEIVPRNWDDLHATA